MVIRLKNVVKRINDLFVPDMSIGTLDSAIEVSCDVRGSITLTSPTFILTDNPTPINYWSYNYVYCPKWNRYYFIVDCTIDGHLIYLHCSEDYLASWADKILNSTFYCTRCVSDYNEKLTDVFFPAQARTITRFDWVDSPWENIKNGQYVIAITSGGNDDPHIGSNTYYIMDDDEITDFMNDLLSKAELTISGIVESLVRSMVNPIQYVRSCYWFPFKLDCETKEVDHISFGWWQSNASAKVMLNDVVENMRTEFSVAFEYENYSRTLWGESEREYLKFSPYSQYVLTCFPFGSIKLTSDIVTEMVVNQKDLIINIAVDHITGMGTFQLQIQDEGIPHIVFTTQIAVEVPTGEILQDYAGVVLNSASAIGAAVTGHEAKALTDVYNAIDSVVPAVTAQGTAGGFAQLMINHASWCLARYFQEIDIDSDLVGEPCCKNERVGDLVGFAKFSNVEIAGDMLESELQAINSLLEEGIFIGEENA